MAQYRFVVSDGSKSSDIVILPSLAEDRRQAVLTLAEILRDDPDELWRDGKLRLLVQNERDETLFGIDTVAV